MLLNFLRRIKGQLLKKKPKVNHQEIFSTIYRENHWGTSADSEYYSGDGSDAKHSIDYVAAIAHFIRDHDIKSVVDLGCGDFRVGREIVKQSQVSYTGVDVVKDLVDHNEKNYSSSTIHFIQRNIVEDALPVADLCLIRQVLQHLSNGDIKKILKKCSQYKYLIVTEHLPTELTAPPNMDKTPDASIRYYHGSGVYLDKPPFNKTLEQLLEVLPKEYPGSKIVTYKVSL